MYPSVERESGLSRSAHRAGAGASAAVNAGIRIDNHLRITQMHGADRTNRSASTAFNTTVINY